MVLVQPETIAAYTAKGWWGQQTLWDLFVQQVSARGDAEAVVDACNRSRALCVDGQRYLETDGVGR